MPKKIKHKNPYIMHPNLHALGKKRGYKILMWMEEHLKELREPEAGDYILYYYDDTGGICTKRGYSLLDCLDKAIGDTNVYE